MPIQRFNVSYVEVLEGGVTVASCYQAVENGEGSSKYGSVGDSVATPDLFHKLIGDLVVPKVVPVEGNKVTKVSLPLIDGYDCYYTTTSLGSDESYRVFVCFTRTVIPKILPIRLLSELKTQSRGIHNDDELSLKVGEILDSFHQELRSYSNETGTESADAAENDLQDIVQVMNDNIDKFLQRQERISLLVDKTSQLNNNSHTFKRKANRIKQRMWWHRMKNITLLVFAVILFISAILFPLLLRKP
ncbi:hypothetical protein HG537_0H01790 [Torulaspora globosa]|uniref:V-SNARE coiled-coil homology domain-containing protein n=1 Tax=Torulaspora globosa TaxID=48254 RepID=A0A7H9HZR1_9SACH|nr:hypothetical protein HG537_0H01790 [Torulaspora sp. CBS 2947]